MARAKNPLSFDEKTMRRIYSDAGICFVCGCTLKKCVCEPERVEECTCSDRFLSGLPGDTPCHYCVSISNYVEMEF